ncbi:hypothetical protein ACC771_20725, partial [Rhizobium ruizarguesonis]
CYRSSSPLNRKAVHAWMLAVGMLIALQAPGQPYQDGTAYAGDYVNDALRFDAGGSIDSLHLNELGVSIIAGFIGDRLIADGW